MRDEKGRFAKGTKTPKPFLVGHTPCNSHNDLTVDHILSWATHPEERFNMNNCRTLCARCHYMITFGKEMPSNVRVWGHTYMEVNK